MLMISISVNCQSIDSYINFKEYDKFNSLRIISYIHDSKDCGEWGGHKEQITIYKNNGILWFHYKRNQSDCELSIELHRRKLEPQSECQDTLTAIKQELVSVYLNELVKHVPNSGNVDFRIISNAPNNYEVQYQNNCLTNSFNIQDEDTSWKKYERFRNEIIKIKQHHK